MDFRGTLYRAINPIWARDPTSGYGAAVYGGRFNERGTPALYCALTPLTALREANQVGDLQPTTMVAYRAEIDGVFDTRDVDAMAGFGMTADALADPAWRDVMFAAGTAPTQAFASRLIAEGYRGLLVRSFARGATANDLNLVLWRWGAKPPALLTLIDDEGRLA